MRRNHESVEVNVIYSLMPDFEKTTERRFGGTSAVKLPRHESRFIAYFERSKM